MSGCFSCGDLLFDDSHPLSKVLVQKQNLNCESDIERGCYNHAERRMQLKSICIHCGEMGRKGFLLEMPELRERCITKGYECFHVCVKVCLKRGKKIVNKGTKQNKTETRKEKERKEAMKKSAGN